ncbi:hypothetical protein TWF481_010471 [Arthrobotrys musiformis]|uniref:Uncharacterized protein n=1 Tax=Arthrobotrys musiformis TaxID=47236 RepID=A0AAV9W2V9_9PEZI
MARFAASKLLGYSQAFSILFLSSFPNVGNCQSTTTTITSTSTETWIVKDVSFSTVTTHIPWCPLPTGNITISASGAIVVQISFRANVTDGSDSGDGIVTFVVNRNGDDIVVSNDPLILSLNTDLILQEYSNTPQRLYFSLPSDTTSHKIAKRFDDLLPVFVSDQIPTNAAYAGWFEDTEGEFFIKVLTSEGEVILGFTVCPADGTAAAGQRVYMYDLSLGVPNADQCVRAAANTLPYPSWTAGSTSLPTGISLDPYGPGGDSTTLTTGTGTSIGTSSTFGSTITSDSTDTDTITSPATTATSTGTSSRRTSNTDSNSNGDSSSTDSNGSDSSSSTASNSSSTDTRSYYTTTFWTTGVADGTTSATSTTDAAGTITVSEYQPYPSSLKIVSTRDGATSSAILYIKYLISRSLYLISPRTYEDYQNDAWPFYDTMHWVLNSQGHLFSPISGVRTIQGEWTGLGYNVTRLYLVGSIPTANDIPTFGGKLLQAKEGTEILDTDVFYSFSVSSSGTLTLNTTVNATAGSGIWLCNEAGTYLGITDSSDSACNWDLITDIHMQGNPVIVDSPEVYYGFQVPASSTRTYTEGLGDGATVTRHNIVAKSIVSVTSELTAGDAYWVTTGTGLKVETATVTFGQRVIRTTSDDAWNITVSATSSVIGASQPTKTVIQLLAPTGDPAYRMYWTGGSGSNRKYFVLSSDTTDENRLMLYGDGNTDASTQRWSLFWTSGGGNDMLARAYNSTHRYLNPTYSYFVTASNQIRFYLPGGNVAGSEQLLWDVTTGNVMAPRQPANTNWGDGDLGMWMCDRDSGTDIWPSGPNIVYLATSGSTASQLGLGATCFEAISDFSKVLVEYGTWAGGDFWKRDEEDGPWTNTDGLTYEEFVAAQE